MPESLPGKWNCDHDDITIFFCLFVLLDQQNVKSWFFLEVSFWTAAAYSWLSTKMCSTLFGETTRTGGQSSSLLGHK